MIFEVSDAIAVLETWDQSIGNFRGAYTSASRVYYVLGYPGPYTSSRYPLKTQTHCFLYIEEPSLLYLCVP